MAPKPKRPTAAQMQSALQEIASYLAAVDVAQNAVGEALIIRNAAASNAAYDKADRRRTEAYGTLACGVGWHLRELGLVPAFPRCTTCGVSRALDGRSTCWHCERNGPLGICQGCDEGPADGTYAVTYRDNTTGTARWCAECLDAARFDRAGTIASIDGVPTTPIPSTSTAAPAAVELAPC